MRVVKVVEVVKVVTAARCWMGVLVDMWEKGHGRAREGIREGRGRGDGNGEGKGKGKGKDAFACLIVSRYQTVLSPSE